ncbi:MAG: T9SS type A sorting domain-containing protein, partial [Bacteroidota bacterium]|nr:T9SS type A sorting domain-containing protein [Bacteroidota bacterium]
STELGNLYTSGNNLTHTYSFKGIFNNWGGVTKTEVDFNEMLPTVAFHGELDTIVKIDADNSFLHYTLNGSRAIHNDLIVKNICSELTVDTIGGHGIFRNASSGFRAGRASCFFKSIFCSTCINFYTTDSIPSTCSSPVSINENYFDQNFKVYPNPFDNFIKIEGVKGALDITIYNSFGQLVYKDEKSNGEIQISLMPGIYLLATKHLGSNKTFTTKLIKN